MDSALRVAVDADLPHRPEAPVEAAAYFAVSELLANAARHGGAKSTTRSTSAATARTCGSRWPTTAGRRRLDPGQRTGRHRAQAGGLRRGDGHQQPRPAAPARSPWSCRGVRCPRTGPASCPSCRAGSSSRCWPCLTAWCPLFPQEIVAAIFKLFDVDEEAWFLALYLPEPWQWPAHRLHDRAGPHHVHDGRDVARAAREEGGAARC